MVDHGLGVAEEHARAVGNGAIAIEGQRQAELRVGIIARFGNLLVKDKNDPKPMGLGGMRRGGVNQRGVVTNEGKIPGFRERTTAVDVRSQKSGAYEIGGPATAAAILRRIRKTQQDVFGELDHRQLDRFKTVAEIDRNVTVRLVDDARIDADVIRQ
jgi:hypothetical protein